MNEATDIVTVETTADPIAEAKAAVSTMTDRELLEAVYISNQTMKAQHEKMIELMQATLEGIEPLMQGINNSPVLKMLGIKMPSIGKDKGDE